MGLRGPHANPIVRWRKLRERQRKHRCRHCRRLFSGRRSDAKFCGDSCKSLAYLRRRAQADAGNAPASVAAINKNTASIHKASEPRRLT
jgi:hypothetical protein